MPYPQDRPNPPAHVLRVAAEGSVDGVNWANVFWIRNGGGQTPQLGNLTALLDDIGDLYENQFLNVLASTVSLSKIVGLYYGPTGGDIGSEVEHAATGGDSTQALPNNCSMCISWHVIPRYKGGHPRTYLPPSTVARTASPRLWQTAEVTGMAQRANNFLASINGATHGELSDLHLGTVSFVLRGDWRSPPVFRDFSPNGATVDARIDSMRRRLGPDII